MIITLTHYLVLSTVIFSIGVYGVLTRRNILGILISIELMFNAANLNLVAFNRFVHPVELWGQGITIFVITLAAAEAVVGLSLVLAVYRDFKSVFVDRVNLLKG